MDGSPFAAQAAVRPLRICMVTGEYPPRRGGVADYTALLVDALRDRGHSVHVLTFGGGHSADPARITIVPGWDWAAAVRLARQAQSMSADVVHLQYQTAAFGMSPLINVLPLALRRLGIGAPFVTTFHDLRPPFLFPKAGPIRGLANHLLIGLSDACIFTDPSDLVRAHPRRAHAWIPMGPTVLPRPGYDRQSARRALGIGEGETILGYFGFVNASKGVDHLLRACERLVRAGLEFRLLFVGDSLGASDPTNAETTAATWALAEELDLHMRLVHTGPLEPDALSQALRAPDLYVLPFMDGASLRRSSLLTCLAHGVPVVTTTVIPTPALPEGVSVPPFTSVKPYALKGRVMESLGADDAALARVIFRALNDPEGTERAQMSGLDLARELDWSNVADATTNFYVQLTGEDARRRTATEKPTGTRC